MKLKKGFVKREYGTKYLIVPTGKLFKEYSDVVILDEHSAEVFDFLNKGTTIDEMLSSFKCDYPGVPEELFLKTINDNIDFYKENNLFEE